MFMELKLPKATIKCFEDNLICKGIVEGTCSVQRTRHIENKYQFIRDHYVDKKLELYHVPTDEQIADIFTKNLPRPKFEKQRSKLCIIDPKMKGSVEMTCD